MMGVVDELFGEGTSESVMLVYAEYVPHANMVAVKRVSDDKLVVRVTHGSMEFYDSDQEVIYTMLDSDGDGDSGEDERIDLLLDLAWGEDFHKHVMVTLDAVAVFADAIGNLGDDAE